MRYSMVTDSVSVPFGDVESYRNLPAAADEVDSERVGGRVEFLGFEDGTWIVSNWRIRMPVITEEDLGRFGGRRLRLSRIVEEGGRVARAWRPGSESVAYSDSDLLGTIDGEISLDAAESEYGSVLLMGVGTTAPVDASGRFHIEDLPAGRYRLAYLRSEMLGLDRTLVEAEVEVTAAGPNTVTLAPRSKTAVLAEICGLDEWLVETAVLLGEVLDRRTGVAVTGAEVRAVWQRFTEVRINAPVLIDGYEGSITTKTNELGAFRICGVPNDNMPIRVSAQLGTRTSREQRILIPHGQLVMSVVIDWEIEVGRYR